MATFDNVNLDLMYALPGQTRDEALADIRAAIAFAPAHVSAYHLTLEPNTLFHRYPPALPDDDVSAAMQEAIEEALAAAGYENYETSAFARPGRRSRHNLNYWRFGDYLGVGAGAHSKLSYARARRARVAPPAAEAPTRTARSPATPIQEIARGRRGRPALRVRDERAAPRRGLRAVALFTERTGLALWPSSTDPLARAEAAGLVERDAFAIRPTLRGRRFLNDLLGLFLSGRPKSPAESVNSGKGRKSRTVRRSPTRQSRSALARTPAHHEEEQHRAEVHRIHPYPRARRPWRRRQDHARRGPALEVRRHRRPGQRREGHDGLRLRPHGEGIRPLARVLPRELRLGGHAHPPHRHARHARLRRPVDRRAGRRGDGGGRDQRAERHRAEHHAHDEVGEDARACAA